MSETIVAGHRRHEAAGLAWFEPLEPLAGRGRVVMTARSGGMSRPPYDRLNLGLHVGDVGERVRLNRLALQKALPKGLLDPVVGEQVHGTGVARVGRLHAGTRWQQNEAALKATDALVTDARALPLVTLVADCLPIALIDPVAGLAAAVHAGWRGLAGGILEQALRVMSETWGSLPEDVTAWIGPAIGSCCYEVGPEVAAHFPAHALPGEGDRSRLDLRSAAAARLAREGLVVENVTGMHLCTCCEAETFFSHRRATRDGQAATGRLAMLVWLEGRQEPDTL